MKELLVLTSLRIFSLKFKESLTDRLIGDRLDRMIGGSVYGEGYRYRMYDCVQIIQRITVTIKSYSGRNAA